MRRFTPLEFGSLLFSAVLLVSGFIFIVWPRSMIMYNPSDPATSLTVGHETGSTLVVSSTGSVVYGVFAMIFGAGIAVLVICCREKR